MHIYQVSELLNCGERKEGFQNAQANNQKIV